MTSKQREIRVRVQEVITRALAELDANSGKEGYRQPYDRALHVQVLIEDVFTLRLKKT